MQVLLVSAQQALLSRLVLQGKLDKDVAMRFGRLAFGSKAGKFTSQEHRAAAEEMLTECGLAELEETVLAFLYAHSGSLKLLALLDDLVRMLQQVRFHDCLCLTALYFALSWYHVHLVLSTALGMFLLLVILLCCCDSCG